MGLGGRRSAKKPPGPSIRRLQPSATPVSLGHYVNPGSIDNVPGGSLRLAQAPAGPLPIPRPGSDGSYAGDNHFQYINVPAHKTFEWGYRRGNPHHNREEYLSQKDHTFKAKLKWSDEYGGHGEHYYD